MKIQFSLRSLIIMCLLAAIPVYLASGYYLEHVQWPETRERADAIQSLIQHLTREKVMNSKGSPFKYVNYSSYSQNGMGEWTLIVTINYTQPPRKVGYDVDDDEHAFFTKISCTRSHFQVEPMLIEYDDSPENEAFIAELKTLFAEKHWQYTINKVAKLSH